MFGNFGKGNAKSALNVFGGGGGGKLNRKQSHARLVKMMRAREEHNAREAAKLAGIDE